MYYCSGKSLAVDCSAQAFNSCSDGEKSKKTKKDYAEKSKQLHSVQSQDESTIPVLNTVLVTQKKNTMTYARTFGVQIAAYFIQKNKTNSLYGDYDFMFSTPGLVEEKKNAVKEAVKVGLFNSIY